MYIPTRYIDSAEVEKAVDAFIKTLGPEVVRVRYNIGEDWMGDPALYFRVLLAVDASSHQREFLTTAKRIERAFFDELKPLEKWGLFPHVSFRSEPVQTHPDDPSWV